MTVGTFAFGASMNPFGAYRMAVSYTLEDATFTGEGDPGDLAVTLDQLQGTGSVYEEDASESWDSSTEWHASQGFSANRGGGLWRIDWSFESRSDLGFTDSGSMFIHFQEPRAETGEMQGTESPDLMIGTSGEETLRGGGGDDRLYGDWGADWIYGGAGNDFVNGDDGISEWAGGPRAGDHLFGGAGDDTYRVDHPEDTVTESAGEGTDTVVAILSWRLGANQEHLRLHDGLMNEGIEYPSPNGTGNALDNMITGSHRGNVLTGRGGTDTLAGGYGDDLYVVNLTAAGQLEDVVSEQGGNGVDSIRLQGRSTNTSPSTIFLPAGCENITAAETGASLLGLIGNAAHNKLVGNTAANQLRGAAGNDMLAGRAGNDLLFGGSGRDTLAGGTGADVFDFNAAAESTLAAADLLADFVRGTDRIDLSTIDAASARDGNQAFSFIGRDAFSSTNATGQLRYRYDAGRDMTIVYGSTDRDADPEFALHVAGVPALGAADFIL